MKKQIKTNPFKVFMKDFREEGIVSVISPTIVRRYHSKPEIIIPGPVSISIV